jgi:hypothetical protein
VDGLGGEEMLTSKDRLLRKAALLGMIKSLGLSITNLLKPGEF